MAREYSARLGQYDIGRWEYREAQAMARRYPCLMRKMRVLSGRRMGGINGEYYATHPEFREKKKEEANHAQEEASRQPVSL